MKKIIRYIFILMLTLVFSLSFAACEEQPDDEQQIDTGLLLGFENYDDVHGALAILGNHFGKTEINTDSKYITQGEASLHVMPQGDYGRTNYMPYIKLNCINSTIYTSDFSDYEYIELDVYNDTDIERQVIISLNANSYYDTFVDTPKITYTLEPEAWNTVRYDLNMSTYFDLSLVSSIRIDFVQYKTEKDSAIGSLYLDNLRGKKAVTPIQRDEFEIDFSKTIGFEKESEQYIFEPGIQINLFTLSRASYDEEGIDISEYPEFQDYCLKALGHDSPYPAITVRFGETVLAGSTLEFYVYIDIKDDEIDDEQYPPLPKIECFKGNYDRVRNNVSAAYAYDKWFKVTITLSTDADETWFFYNLSDSNGNSILAGIDYSIYMDNFVLPTTITYDIDATLYYTEQTSGFYNLDSLNPKLSHGTGDIVYEVYDSNEEPVNIVTEGENQGFNYTLTENETVYYVIMSEQGGKAEAVRVPVYIMLPRDKNIVADFEYVADLARFSSNTGTLTAVEDPDDNENTVLKYVADTQFTAEGSDFTNRIFIPDIPLGYKLSYNIKFVVGDTTISGNWFDYMAVFTRGMEPTVEYHAWAPETSNWHTITTSTITQEHGYFYLYIPYNRSKNVGSVDMTQIAVYIDNIVILPPEIVYDTEGTVHYTEQTTGFYDFENLNTSLTYGISEFSYEVFDSDNQPVSVIGGGFYYDFTGTETYYTVKISDLSDIAEPITVNIIIMLPRDKDIIADFEYSTDIFKFSTNTGELTVVEDPLDSSNTVLKYVCSTQYSSVSFTNRLFFPDIPVGYKMSYDIKFELGNTSIPGNWYDYMATFTRGMEPQVDYVAWAPEYSSWHTITTPTAVGTHGYFYVYIPYNRNNNMPDVDMTEIFVYIDNVRIISE